MNGKSEIIELDTQGMKLDKYREMRIDCTDSMGDACKSLSIETCMTFDELTAFVRELMGDAE